MLDKIFEVNLPPIKWDWKVLVALALVSPFILTFVISSANSKPPLSKDGKPPTLPYVVPYFGHLYEFLTRGRVCLRKAADRMGVNVPFKFVLPGNVGYVVHGPDLVSAFLSESRELTSHMMIAEVMCKSFGMPKQSAALYAADDSGMHSTINPDSAIKPENRILFTIHNMVVSHLQGNSLTGITARYQENLARQFEENDSIGLEWVEIPDFYLYMKSYITSAALRSMFGTELESLNPTIIKDFWIFNAKMGPLFLGIPRWVDPEAYQIRDKLLDGIMKWHAVAEANFDCSKNGEDDVDWEPYFGSKFSRTRQHTFKRFKAMDARARAAEDLGIMWASQSNAVPAATWMLLEILMDSKLSSNMEKMISATAVASNSASPNPVPVFDVVKLCADPLLQSIYAETLRTRVAILFTRMPMRDNFNLCGWTFNGNDKLFVCSSTEALDENVWNTGNEEERHPIDKFWAERFLIYPNDPKSGPKKQKGTTRNQPVFNKSSRGKETEDGADGAPQFSMKGLTSSWVPYGGGLRHCPGRHFAKQEMISTAAIWMSAYETELIAIDGKPFSAGAEPQVDAAYFGWGTMPPKGKISCRVRRRQLRSS